MAMGVRSIRTKFLLLVAGVATVVGGVSVVYDLVASQGLLREQMAKRGRYIASNLAFNSKYGVLTEDKPLLTQFLEGAVAAGGGATGSDVVGGLLRRAAACAWGARGRGGGDPGARPWGPRPPARRRASSSPSPKS